MRLPIDTTGMTFLAAAEPEPVADFATKVAKTDEHGAVIHACQLVVLADGGAEVISVKTAGKPAGIDTSTPVTVSGLVATPWSMGERSGVSFRAEQIAPAVTGRGQANVGPAGRAS